MNIVENFLLEETSKPSEYENTCIGSFYYNGGYFSFICYNEEALYNLNTDRSPKHVIEVLKNITIYKVENGAAMYLVCNRDFAETLSLHISRAFSIIM